MLVRTAIGQCLADLGVESMFGVLGGGNMYMIHELVDCAEITYVPVAREDGAILMAAGYARAANRLGFATVTYGGSITNTVTALVEADRSHSPVLVLTGDYPVTKSLNERELLQHINIGPVVRSAGVEYRRIQSAEHAVAELRAAAEDALLQSRPIVVGVPTDLQEVEVQYTPVKPVVPDKRRAVPDPQEMDIAAGMVASSRRPLIVAGRGALLSDARDAIVELAETIGSPLATTLMAKGMFRGDPWDIGVYGGLSSDPATEVIAAADCLVVIGASLSDLTTSNGSLLEGKRIVQCDTSKSSLRRWDVKAGVLSDARLFAEALTAMVKEAGVLPSGGRSEALRQKLLKHDPESEYVDHSDDEGLDMRTVVLRLSKGLPQSRNVVTDGGRFVYAALRNMSVPEGGALLPAISFGAIGQGMATAIGVSFAMPDRPTVLLTGDGGLLMCIMEFRAAVEFDRDLIVLVMNDGAYGQEYHRFRLAGMSTDLSRILRPDFAAMATAMGGTGMIVRRLDELDEAIASVQDRRGPVLLDLRIQSTRPIGFYD